jgi:hypothetical protein
MRRRAVYTVLIAVLVSLGAAGPAAAGGPTSVLLVAPGTGSTASLYTTDSDYQTLAEVLGALGPGPGPGRISDRDHATGSVVTATWLIHDVSVWRVDRIYLDTTSGPWVATQADVGGSGDIWSSPVVWHQVPDGLVLADLLGRLGLVDGDTAPEVVADAAPTVPAAAPSRPARADPAGTPVPAGPWWGLGGLALGVVLTLVALRGALARRTEPAEAWSPQDEVLSSSRG